MKPKAVFNWSSGKDSALALYAIQKENNVKVTSLLTSINTEYQRVSMHGVPISLLEQQAKSLDLPLIKMEIPKEPTMEEYQKIMAETMNRLQSQGITHSVFGDIFLEDLRNYREEQLKSIGMKAVFPLWKKNTLELIYEFIDLGFKTIVSCVNETYLDKSFAGRVIDENFIKDLPENVDPCGENGEFHTFTFDGPIFNFPIEFEVGEIVKKTYPRPKESEDKHDGDYVFWFCDLVPKIQAHT
ncbi:Dph6-related ATP pyrophosphatase [Chryseobacterium sp. CT-SW4]|uniref:Dph6-related ATP pyrophosphatase n=1 Tax=Chryseobacterium sp. SW-1 TaxID=3157343 RepID=UPI003B025721